MAGFEEWKLVDIFSVEQAANLWAGIPPGTLNFESEKIASFEARKAMLFAAITKGELEADHSPNSLMAGQRNYLFSLVTRASLESLALDSGSRNSLCLLQTAGRSRACD